MRILRTRAIRMKARIESRTALYFRTLSACECLAVHRRNILIEFQRIVRALLALADTRKQNAHVDIPRHTREPVRDPIGCARIVAELEIGMCNIAEDLPVPADRQRH